MISGSLSSWLNLRPGEERSATLLLLHSFFMGLSTVYFETAASALFLARFDAGLLPWVYIAAAALNTVTGFAYARIRQRLPFARLMTSTLVFLLTFVCLFRVGLAATDAAWLVFALFIYYRVLSILTDLEYWAVATRIYDVRQAKRLFSLVGSGEVVARTVGSFSVPFLVGLMKVSNLIVISALGLAGCFVVLVAIIRAFPDINAPEERVEGKEDAERAGAWAEFARQLRNRYLRLIFFLAVLAVLGKYFVDFAFLAEMQTRYQNVESLAGFFGVFSGVTQVVNLLMRVFLSGRFISRFGVKSGLLVLPLAHAAVTALILLAGGLGEESLVFWLVISNQGVYKTLKHPIDNPSFKVLYQPLRPMQRLSAQIAVEAILTPVTIGFAGAIMLLFSVVVPYDPVQFAYVLLITFLAWIAAAILAFRQYSVSLLDALKKRTLDGSSVSLTDPGSIELVRRKLASPEPADVVFSLDFLRKVEHPSLDDDLIALLRHPSDQVRRYVLLQLEPRRTASALEPVSQTLSGESSPSVRAAALRALAAVGGETSFATVARHLQDEAPEVRRGAMVGLLRAGDPEATSLAERRLERLVGSDDPEERALAAEVLGEVPGRRGDLLPALLEDPVPSVRRAALKAAGRLRDRSHVPVLIRHLSHPLYRSVATTSLTSAGETALDALGESILGDDLPRHTVVRVAKILGRVRGPGAIRALRRGMSYPDALVRKEILKALEACRYRAQGEDAAAIREQIREEVADTAWKMAAIGHLANEPGLALVETSLSEEAERNRERVFLLLSFISDRKSVRSAWENLAHQSRERRAYALELIDVTVPKDLKHLILPLAESLSPLERLERLVPDSSHPWRTAAGNLREILERPDMWMTGWSKACAAYTAANLSRRDLFDTLKPLSISRTSLLLAETAQWALSRLSGSDALRETAGPRLREGSHGMLTIEKVMLLKAVPMFSRTSEELLAEVASILEEVELQPGEVIFEKGNVGESMYIVIDGRVRVYDGDKTINYLGEKEIFGELALLDPEPRSASVQAVEETRLFRLDRDTFFDLMADNIGVVSGVMQVLCQRLRRMTAIATERQ